ncbi:MAG TPA: hypothetical protein VNZ22_02075, partial [Bacillota bacterium]|nr:hypothetical protein [Bacillota bacterium]
GKLDNNRHGEQGVLVLTKADAREPVVLGKEGEFSWASFDPSGDQIATLSIKGIAFVDWRTRAVLRTLPRRGFFQQMTWSPDGRWLCGVANSFGTGWSIARMNAGTGEAFAVNTVDCCTPDWFPDGTNVIFSWRPPGQKVNNGYGWTQLWRADAEGRSRSLVYAEDGRHVYGGNISPNGRYVLFTGNMNEDGDPGNAGAPMGLMRLSDAPIIGGSSAPLRAQQPTAKTGPVLVLPPGWEPFWTSYDYGATNPVHTSASTPPAAAGEEALDPIRALANELQPQGMIVFSARNGRGDWDLFVMQPDGSKRRKITDTADYNEAGARFSPDGKRLLYYRLPQSTPVDNNTYGTGELVLANADGTNPQVYGQPYPWASWGPDGQQFACLTPQGVKIVDCATRSVVRQVTRKGIVSQLAWSPDGKYFVGTANGLGPFWNIGCLNMATGEITPLSETERYNCTPDWAPDARKVVYARGIIPQNGGRAELWEAFLDGKQRQTLYAEAGRHIYGACVSPNGKYLLFTRSVE